MANRKNLKIFWCFGGLKSTVFSLELISPPLLIVERWVFKTKTQTLKMKTPEQVTKLNFNDIAFFKGITTSDAKWLMSEHIFKIDNIEEYLTKSGVPKISAKEFLDKKLFETKIKSCSFLEGKNNIDYHIKSFNKGISLTKLMEYSESKTFINSLKFSGKYSILNDILNPEQLLKLQKIWLYKNVYYVSDWSKNCINFIENNKWSLDFLAEKGFCKSEFLMQKEKVYQ